MSGSPWQPQSIVQWSSCDIVRIANHEQCILASGVSDYCDYFLLHTLTHALSRDILKFLNTNLLKAAAAATQINLLYSTVFCNRLYFHKSMKVFSGCQDTSTGKIPFVSMIVTLTYHWEMVLHLAHYRQQYLGREKSISATWYFWTVLVLLK